ncbi:MAG: hypothetical protein SCJ97_06385 [Bacillota bacterium]|nr:hypothetical protein [Bacillota bacterium]
MIWAISLPNWIALKSPEYKLKDYLAWLQGATRGSGPMWEETQDFSLLTDIKKISIPVYFISGVKDRNTPLELVNKYYEVIDGRA